MSFGVDLAQLDGPCFLEYPIGNSMFNMLSPLGSAAMSEVKTFFRHCPQCGRRFEIRVTKAKPLVDDSYLTEIRRSDSESIEEKALEPLILDEANQPLIVEDKKLSYTYTCKHCGHQWTEVRDKVDVELPPEGYTGD
jgi:ribosomal protein L44E